MVSDASDLFLFYLIAQSDVYTFKCVKSPESCHRHMYFKFKQFIQYQLLNGFYTFFNRNIIKKNIETPIRIIKLKILSLFQTRT